MLRKVQELIGQLLTSNFSFTGRKWPYCTRVEFPSLGCHLGWSGFHWRCALPETFHLSRDHQ